MNALAPCPRTLCLYKPGVPIPGVVCTYAYTGSIPCTGQQRCMTCGALQPETPPFNMCDSMGEPRCREYPDCYCGRWPFPL